MSAKPVRDAPSPDSRNRRGGLVVEAFEAALKEGQGLAGRDRPGKLDDDPSLPVALVDGGGNVPPELSAARRLVERGHLVTVLAENSVAGEVRATGARLRPWVHSPNRRDRRPEHEFKVPF